MIIDGNEWKVIEPGILEWVGTQYTIQWDGFGSVYVVREGRNVRAAANIEQAKLEAIQHASELLKIGLEP